MVTDVMKNFTVVAILALGLGITLSKAALGDPYEINPGDLLRVDVWNEAGLSREVMVRPDGIISLPMAGEISTKESTPSDVAGRIAEALSQFMRDEPRVVVSLINVDGNKIYVIGKVTSPGQYVVGSDTDVMQALALAGGLNAFAAENDIRILRRLSNGKQVAYPFSYSRVKDGKDLGSNIVLQSRDLVVVP